MHTFAFRLAVLGLVVGSWISPVSAAQPAAAPDDQLMAVARLVQEDKLAEAAKRVDALLVLYAGDPRLAKLKTQLAAAKDAAPAAPASAVPAAGGTAAGGPWSGMGVLDRVAATTVESIAREAEKLPVGAERRAKFGEMLERTANLTGKYPNHARLWLFHGVAALERDDFAAGYAAGERLLALSPDPDQATLQVLAGLERKSWLGEKGAQRKTQTERAERARAEALAKGKEFWSREGRDRTVADLGITLVALAPGTFQMGSTNGDGDERPVTEVTLSRGFWLGKTEVTQAQWQTVMGGNPSFRKGETLPVENVSWDDAMAFCRKLTERERAAGRLPEGYSYTLPTEAQWEFACRAGTTGDYAGKLDELGWYNGNSGNQSRPVATKQPNAWGLHDMHGNVWEWCLDWHGNYPGGSVTDPTGAASGSYRVYRGGGWGLGAARCRSALRYGDSPGFRGGYLGFRLALSFSP